MIPEIARGFYLDPELVYLNHASYGAPTRELMALVSQTREWIERDTALALGPNLYQRLSRSAECVADLLGATTGSLALVPNSTSAASALATSLLRGRPIRVAMLDLEYSSVIAAWRERVGAAGGSLTLVPVPLPLDSADALLAILDELPGEFDAFVVSAITSSTALALPLPALRDWARRRGARVVVDGAQAGLQEPLDIDALDVAAVYGSLHKWLPVPRSVGYLWVADDLVADVRPTEVSLNWYDDALLTRFGWRGTWDPAPALRLPEAIAAWQRWQDDGSWTRAGDATAFASYRLTQLGLIPTGPAELLPPLLRAYLVPGVDRAFVDDRLRRAGIRAWVGAAGGQSVVRVATHVYSSREDIVALADCLASILADTADATSRA